MRAASGPSSSPTMRVSTASGALLGFVLLLAGCAGTPSRHTPPEPPPHLANAVLMRAIGLVGTPYRYGGTTPQGGFDCSGLIGFVFRDAAELQLPRSTAGIAGLAAPTVPRSRLAAGDLVLFGERGAVSHIGIYVGDARFVHAPSSGGTVRLDPLDAPHWQQRFLGGRRLLR
jgi:cell wall-associated NlpC family hydrolase